MSYILLIEIEGINYVVEIAAKLVSDKLCCYYSPVIKGCVA
jgi:hypothetical protein